ncbi:MULTISPECIES: AAA family ATPase [unclassified Streptomyces]|uniref:AAA family ATPase n=1 Tax=unclassified Streptomyces TaxID=2593676 RepID=UPI0040419EDD
MNRTPAYAATATAATTGITVPKQRSAPAPVVRDLRDRAGRGPRALLFGPRDLVVITGLPGSGKSTLMRRAVTGPRVDSQDTRDRWDARTPRLLPYALYRPLVRLAHYAALRRALRTGEGVVVHDCGTQPWVRRWLAREARRRGAALHLLLLDVTPATAREGQRERGRGVSAHAFRRHRRTTARLIAAVEAGEPPAGCGSATLLDRPAANALHRIAFTA